MPHTADEIRLSQERRDAILNFVLEYFTGDQISRKDLGHFAFLAQMFGITGKVKDMCRASSIQGRQELAVTVALAALNVALDDSPPQPTERQLERQEARAAAKEFEEKVAAIAKPAAVATDAEPEPSAQDKLDRIRAKNRDRQRERRARLKAEKAGNSRIDLERSDHFPV